jgi:cobalt/nickel transport system permease protein
MMRRLAPAQSRALLAAALVAVFALSAVRDLRVLAVATAVALVLFRRGLGSTLRRVVLSVVPVTLALSLVSFGWLRLVGGAWPDFTPFAALALRAGLIALVTFSVLDRVDLLRAVAPFPTVSRLLVITLAQIHALRLVATDSLEGLKSRLPRKPGALDVLRGAGGITAALFTLSLRNAREISDAMRSRGF